jgi:hypothetical protein
MIAGKAKVLHSGKLHLTQNIILGLYDNDFTLIIDIYFFETFSTPNTNNQRFNSLFRHCLTLN